MSTSLRCASSCGGGDVQILRARLPFLGQSADFQGIPHLVLHEVHATHVNPIGQH